MDPQSLETHLEKLHEDSGMPDSEEEQVLPFQQDLYSSIEVFQRNGVKDFCQIVGFHI